MGTSPDPLSIECPLCGAAPGAECSGTVGDDLWHIARDEAWRAQRVSSSDYDPLTVECRVCAAPVGGHCARLASDRRSIREHHARYDDARLYEQRISANP